ncbi:Holliday junction resolvase RuvX [Labrenzia sp. VG12]|uniref:Holliday junction resolvase RuvX n=1 Tax=Labrenzia sp. VG12 TaxID=2021862 RepID=UPI000B8BDDF6|nr:Holliday junction resolvase RuvX [Labrenzia sp. VG12]ASP32429.1 Holliday junction resolvase RuvX [Labrenzia sp. VG12]
MANDPGLLIEDFMATVPQNTRLIGLDLGTKTIGLALSDLGRGIASPMETIRRKKFTLDAERLLQICAEQGVGGIVLGLPLNMDGSEGPRAQATRAFARNLSQKTDLPITYWDERLSTAAVTRTLLEADSSRAKRAEAVDKMAAAFILQGFLDRLGFMDRD